MFDNEFLMYDIDSPEVRALQRALPTEIFALVEGLMARWQQAGMPLKPSRRGFAFQAPHGDRLTTVAWIYTPNRRYPDCRIEVALSLLARRQISVEQIEELRDNLTRFPTYHAEVEGPVLDLPVTDMVNESDMDRLASILVQFGLSLA